MGKHYFLIPVALLVLHACSQDVSTNVDDIPQWQGEPTVAQPWLRDQLPESILAYHRIPHPLGVLTSPKGNVFDVALGSDANVRNVLSIQQGLADNILDALPSFGDVRFKVALEKIHSPIEIAAFGPPKPSALTAMTLDVGSVEEFQALMDQLSEVGPFLSLAGPLDGSGSGQLDGLPASTFLKFDAGSGRLLMQTGPHVTAESFAELADGLVSGAGHAMYALEELVDESGQGWFAWLDTQTTFSMAQLFLPIEITQKIRETGLDGARSAAFGGGVANGKGRLSFVLDVGEDHGERFLPLIDNEITATSVGQPDGVVLFSIPTAEEFGRIESLMLKALPAHEKEEWADTKESFLETTGVSMDELFSALGPEILLILDAAGDYLGVRLRDADLFDDIVRRLAEKVEVAPVTHEAHGTTFYHWNLPGIYSAIKPEDFGEIADLGVLLQRQREHWHWIVDGDFLYASTIPQPLMDRVRMGADSNVSTWLVESQRVDMSSSLFAATGSVEKVPRRIYHLYVEMMQYLADFGEADYDVWAMPTAGQLGLPDKGALGFSMNLGDPYISMEFSFESNPGEFLVGAGFGSVAMIGILAAIAVPAYQDYTMRAKISAGMSAAARVKAAVAEQYVTTGRFPDEAAALVLGQYDTGEYVRSITVEPNTGVIVIDYDEDAINGGGRVYWQPTLTDDGGVIWSCSGTVADQYLPSACRDNAIPELLQGV